MIGERIKELRGRHSISQSQLAKLMFCSQQAIAKYETGKSTPNNEMLAKLADYFGVTTDYLLGRDGSKLPEGAIPVDISTFVKIPVYGEVSAGFGAFAEGNIIDYEYVSPDSIDDYEDYFFLKVKGDSMEPRIEEGDLALVRKQKSVDSGSLAVVIIDDENGVIKKVYYDDEWIELVSFNPNYPPRMFKGAEVQRIYVVGLVKSILRKF